ncbi:expressed unknown protein [Ectocarpus siliculosus]|uniref:Uncharacterized protein n=1 Tax=Ectocarpus siliculosus TaxID=2880 RepID=D7FKZ8_ECTSI|nr:expressed unknown protein [Ectocarpus siliculosus]|eukprot:CBJ29541.1 expressed unknown protein [Ectocarpus siliculosus]
MPGTAAPQACQRRRGGRSRRGRKAGRGGGRPKQEATGSQKT